MGYDGDNFKIYMEGYREGCKDTTMRLGVVNGKVDEEVREPISPEVQKELEDIWGGFGEPMTQEELDELTEVEEDNSYIDELSFIQGKKIGFDCGYEVGYSEAEDDIYNYNIVLDGEFLDQIKEFKNQILRYRKEYDNGKNKDHNHMIFDLHHSLICLTESWVMDQVWKYWAKDKGDTNE